MLQSDYLPYNQHKHNQISDNANTKTVPPFSFLLLCDDWKMCRVDATFERLTESRDVTFGLASVPLASAAQNNLLLSNFKIRYILHISYIFFYLWFLTFLYYVYCYALKYQGKFLVSENPHGSKPDSDSFICLNEKKKEKSVFVEFTFHILRQRCNPYSTCN